VTDHEKVDLKVFKELGVTVFSIRSSRVTEDPGEEYVKRIMDLVDKETFPKILLDIQQVDHVSSLTLARLLLL
jgi:hypothetical protein